jgi:hypothetical protein
MADLANRPPLARAVVLGVGLGVGILLSPLRRELSIRVCRAWKVDSATARERARFAI